jgi:hypothetical protein
MSKRGWVSSLVGLFWILLAATTLLAQEVVKTKDGRQVLLKPDGTWVYITEEPPKGAVSTAVPPAKTNPGVVSPNSAGGGTTSPNSLNSDKQKATNQTQKPGNVDTGHTTPTGKTIYQGPRGGCYHYSKSGRKVYGPCPT